MSGLRRWLAHRRCQAWVRAYRRDHPRLDTPRRRQAHAPRRGHIVVNGELLDLDAPTPPTHTVRDHHGGRER